MANNLRKGSKVFINYSGRLIPGIVSKKYTARKGSVSVSKDYQRTVVHVIASGNTFLKYPYELKRRDK